MLRLVLLAYDEVSSDLEMFGVPRKERNWSTCGASRRAGLALECCGEGARYIMAPPPPTVCRLSGQTAKNICVLIPLGCHTKQCFYFYFLKKSVYKSGSRF